jgi:hypothetical protein
MVEGMHIILFIPCEIQCLSHNDDKSVTNCIVDPYVLVAMVKAMNCEDIV